MNKASESCKACRFWGKWWDHDTDSDEAVGPDMGNCCRYPPSIYDGYAVEMSWTGGIGDPHPPDANRFPNTYADQWCGEFDARALEACGWGPDA